MRTITLLLVILGLVQESSAQPVPRVTPHLEGNIHVNMKEGVVRADLRLSGLPALDTNYRILLNRGMNMGLIRDSGIVLRYSDATRGDYLSYQPLRENKPAPLPAELRVSYTGAFPIYTDTLNWFDYKGWIALNGRTLRAADQTKWYPVIYDVVNDRELAMVSYDLQVECADCKTIYLNGADAKPGPVAEFTSKEPRELLLFTGDYKVQQFPGEDFLDADMPQPVAASFDKQVAQIRGYYEKILGIPYKQKISFLEHTPVEYYRPGRSWGFVTFPTIAVAGGHFRDDINPVNGRFIDMGTYKFYAHELAHYYFGSVLHPNSTLNLFFLESTAEYLSLKASREVYGNDSVNAYLLKSKNGLSKNTFPLLSQVTDYTQLNENYRYYYAPLVLMALEQIVGEKKMFAFLRQVLKQDGMKTDFVFFQQTALASGISKAEWERFSVEVLSLTNGGTIYDFLKLK